MMVEILRRQTGDYRNFRVSRLKFTKLEKNSLPLRFFQIFFVKISVVGAANLFDFFCVIFLKQLMIIEISRRKTSENQNFRDCRMKFTKLEKITLLPRFTKISVFLQFCWIFFGSVFMNFLLFLNYFFEKI